MPSVFASDPRDMRTQNNSGLQAPMSSSRTAMKLWGADYFVPRPLTMHPQLAKDAKVKYTVIVHINRRHSDWELQG